MPTLADLEALRQQGSPPPPSGPTYQDLMDLRRSVNGGLDDTAQAFRNKGATGAPGRIEQLLGGAKHGLDRAALGIKGLLPQGVQDFGDALDASMNMGGVNKDVVEKGKAFVDQTGPWSTVGDVGTDVGLSLVPGGLALKGARAVTAGMKGIPRALAAMGAEAGGNAAWSAATAPEDRTKAAMLGAAGSAAGTVGNRLISGPLAHAVTPEARALMDKDIGLTLGQMVTGADAGPTARAARRIEDSMQSLMFLGDVPKYRARQGISDYNIAEFNSILKPLGATVDRAGHAGINDVLDIIAKKKDEFVTKVHIPQKDAAQFLGDMEVAMDNMPLLSPRQRKYMEDWIETHIAPTLKQGDIDGPEAARILRGLQIAAGQAKKRTASDPMNEGLQQILGEYAKGWEQHIAGKLSPEDAKMFQRVQRAELRARPFVAVTEKSAEGTFTPMQMVRELKQHPANKITSTTEQARAVLPETVPDTGTAMRTAIYHAMSPSGLSGAAGLSAYGGFTALTPFILAALAGSVAYTKTGTKYLDKGVLEPALSKITGRPINKDELETVVKLLSQQGAGAGLRNMKDDLSLPGD